MKTSCGIIFLNEQNEVFMAHSTGNKFFDIPKGLLEENEIPIECAIRECAEETSIIIDKERLIDLGILPYNKEKQLHLFLIHIKKEEIDLSSLVCNSFFEDFYTKKLKPEADGFEWIKLNNIEQFCAKSMAKLFMHLKKENIFNKQSIKNKI